MKTTRRKSERGVTLIEMLVVITIIGLIAGLVSVNVIRQGESAKRTAAKAQISTFMNALGIYKLDTGLYPATAQGLQALRVNPGDLSNWAGPYMPKDVPMDPWGRPYVYVSPGVANPASYDLYTLGKDGRVGGSGEDADVTSWNGPVSQ